MRISAWSSDWCSSVLNRPAEVRVDDVMGLPGLRWPVAARQLVRALRPCFHMFQAMGDGVVDRLIIAQLEMEEGHVLRAAPIAAVERVRADQVQGPGDGLSIP